MDAPTLVEMGTSLSEDVLLFLGYAHHSTIVSLTLKLHFQTHNVRKLYDAMVDDTYRVVFDEAHHRHDS